MSDTTVKYFDSTMSGAPELSGQSAAGALIGVLDGCLVDGFGSVTLDGIDGLVVSSNVATAKCSAGHQFTMVGDTGPVITIAGASPAGLNGAWRVTITSTSEFTFATSGIGDQTASGTISAKRAGAGFSKAFSGTNKAAYRSDDVTGDRLYLRVDDTGTTSARMRGYEAMDDVDTVTAGYGIFPTEAQFSGGLYFYKSSGANSTARPWILISDGKMIYLLADSASSGAYPGGLVFGDILSYVASDAYNTLIMGSPGATSAISLGLLNNAGGYLARDYTQLGASIESRRYSSGRISGGMSSGGQPYPAPADNSAHFWPVECWDSTTQARGMMPGLWAPLHDSSLPSELVIEDIPNLPARTLRTQKTNTSYIAAFDITGPWSLP